MLKILLKFVEVLFNFYWTFVELLLTMFSVLGSEETNLVRMRNRHLGKSAPSLFSPASSSSVVSTNSKQSNSAIYYIYFKVMNIFFNVFCGISFNANIVVISIVLPFYKKKYSTHLKSLITNVSILRVKVVDCRWIEANFYELSVHSKALF